MVKLQSIYVANFKKPSLAEPLVFPETHIFTIINNVLEEM